MITLLSDCSFGLPKDSLFKIVQEILSDAGLSFSEFRHVPIFPSTNIDSYLLEKRPEGVEVKTVARQKYLPKPYWIYLDTAQKALAQDTANIIICSGIVATWLITGETNFESIRGTVNINAAGKKYLPTFAFQTIVRAWHYRAILIADLIKAKREATSPLLTSRKLREVWIDPERADLERAWEEMGFETSSAMGIDIETGHGCIRCVGFAPNQYQALCVPFTDARKPHYSYWENPDDEIFAWSFIRRACALPVRKVLQNGLYDIQWLWKLAGTPIRGDIDDTLLKHHALQPELEKSLGFLGSIYANEGAWKTYRRARSASETTKRDE